MKEAGTSSSGFFFIATFLIPLGGPKWHVNVKPMSKSLT